jgi:hypothetical protein
MWSTASRQAGLTTPSNGYAVSARHGDPLTVLAVKGSGVRIPSAPLLHPKPRHLSSCRSGGVFCIWCRSCCRDSCGCCAGQVEQIWSTASVAAKWGHGLFQVRSAVQVRSVAVCGGWIGCGADRVLAPGHVMSRVVFPANVSLTGQPLAGRAATAASGYPRSGSVMRAKAWWNSTVAVSMNSSPPRNSQKPSVDQSLVSLATAVVHSRSV